MAYNPSLDHKAVVARVRGMFPQAELTADQSLSVTNEVAKQLILMGESDAGLNAKSGGNVGVDPATGATYSVDIIAYRDSNIWVDCLGNAGDSTDGSTGPASPAWQTHTGVNVATWRPPFGSPTGPVPPDPDPEPEPEPEPEPDDDLAAIQAQLTAMQAQLDHISQQLSLVIAQQSQGWPFVGTARWIGTITGWVGNK